MALNSALELFNLYKEKVDFLHVYIMEAHACDEWPLGTKTVISQHKSTQERIQVAKNFQKNYLWPFPMVVDTISNEFHNTFAVWPERVFIVIDGKMSYIGYPEEDGYEFLWSDQVRNFFENK